MDQTGKQRKHLAAVALAGVICAACGSATTTLTAPNPAAQAHLMSIDQLAAGKLGGLPTGTQFARVTLFSQAPAERFPSRKHQPGVIYQAIGVQRVSYSDGQSLDIASDTGVFSRGVAHSHINSGLSANRWYFLALWPSEQRGLPPLAASSKVVYETEDLAQSALPPGSYVETLRKATLEPGGHSAAHRLGGLEVLLVLDGALTVNVAGSAAVHIAAGQGTYLAPDTPTQEFDAGSTAVRYLVYVVIADGRPFETDLAAPVSG